MIDYNKIIDKYYGPESALRAILVRHSSQVARKALEIAHRMGLPLADVDIEAAAMLHDIGIYLTDASGIQCFGTEPYIRHGVLGAELLRREGAPEQFARVAERHTGSGLTAADIRSQHLPLPQKDYLPETLLEKLICYADKFYSKSGDMAEKPLERVRASMKKFGEAACERFEALHKIFDA